MLRDYWWLSAFTDVKEYNKTCQICQKLGRRPEAMPNGVITMVQPFKVLAVDFVGPLKKTKIQNVHLLVAMELYSR